MNPRYFSVCSGIEAATAAWHPLGWRAVAFSEIEPFPSAVLAHRYPGIPNLGDMTKIDGKAYRGMVDVLVGGTPCQSFSSAGLRSGLSDERGNLCLKYVELANDIDPDIVLWENVPGVLSIKDNAFGFLLAGLAGETVPLVAPGGKWTDAGCVLGPRRAVAWRCLDAQYFGLAQRRKRLFVVASPPGRADPFKILFESEGVRRDIKPRRPPREEAASCAGESAGAAGGTFRFLGFGAYADDDVASTAMRRDYKSPTDLVADRHDSHWNGGPHPTLNCTFSGKSNQELFRQGGAGLVPALVRMREGKPGGGKGPLVSEDLSLTLGTSNDQALFIYPVDLRALSKVTRGDPPIGDEGAPAYTLTKSKTHGVAVCADVAPTVSASGPPYSRMGNARVEADALVCMETAVRRLTPVEVERLQGFPDDYTLIDFKGKPASDAARYMAVGNSMAIPVMRWLGERMQKELERHEG